METNRLQQFCTLVETQHLRKAAEFHHITHSAMSKSMRVLEEQLGLKLVEQAGRGIAITEAGRRVYESAKELLRQVDAFEQGVKHAPPHPKIRVGTFEVFSTYFMGSLLGSRPWQNHQFEIRELTPGKMEESLAQGQIDFAISYIPIPKPKLVYAKVATITMGLFGKKSQFGETPLGDLPFCAPVSPVEGAPTKVKGLDGWPDHEIPRRIPYQVEMMETALELTRRGLGVVWLPTFVADLHNQQVKSAYRLERIQKSGLPKQSEYPVYLIERQGNDSHAFRQRLVEALQNLHKA